MSEDAAEPGIDDESHVMTDEQKRSFRETINKLGAEIVYNHDKLARLDTEISLLKAEKLRNHDKFPRLDVREENPLLDSVKFVGYCDRDGNPISPPPGSIIDPITHEVREPGPTLPMSAYAAAAAVFTRPSKEPPKAVVFPLDRAVYIKDGAIILAVESILTLGGEHGGGQYWSVIAELKKLLRAHTGPGKIEVNFDKRYPNVMTKNQDTAGEELTRVLLDINKRNAEAAKQGCETSNVFAEQSLEMLRQYWTVRGAGDLY
jgi:hypothetical protein